jgi:hypothetical protein
MSRKQSTGSEVSRPAGVLSSMGSSRYSKGQTCRLQQHVPMYHTAPPHNASTCTKRVRRRSANAISTNEMQVGHGGVHAHGSLRIGVQVRRDSTRSSQIGGHRSGSPLKPPTRSHLIGSRPSENLISSLRSQNPATQDKRHPDRSLHA